jgi:bifunctional non-homologous end joining protein LigD
VELAHTDPAIEGFTSLERTPAKRKKKIYLDFLQNRSIQTLAAPYSVRPRPGAPVSTPLHWEELKKGLEPGNFTILNIHDRLRREGDLFKPVLGKGIRLEQTIKAVQELLGERSDPGTSF